MSCFLFKQETTCGKQGQRAKIKKLDLHDIEIVITDELGGIEYRKLDIRSFQIMAERLGVDYKKMIYIGDNINKDFIAPQQ